MRELSEVEENVVHFVAAVERMAQVKACFKDTSPQKLEEFTRPVREYLAGSLLNLLDPEYPGRPGFLRTRAQREAHRAFGSVEKDWTPLHPCATVPPSESDPKE